MYIDSKDIYSRNELSSLVGLHELLMGTLQMIASAGKIPLTVFLGTSVDGFGTGDNEIRIYYDYIKSKQADISDQLAVVDRIIEMDLFGQEKEISYDWVSLQEPNAQEKVNLQLSNAQRDQIYLDRGIVSDRVVAHGLRKEGVYDLDDEDIEALDDKPMSQEDNEEYAQLMGDLNQGGDNDEEKEAARGS